MNWGAAIDIDRRITLVQRAFVSMNGVWNSERDTKVIIIPM